MRLFAELDPALYEEIQELVSSKKYDSVEQFLRVAAQNQLAIERSEGESNESSQMSKGTASGERRWHYSPSNNIPTGPPYGDHRQSTLLFSQYYRFFPLKCALYHLADLTTDTGGAVSLKRAQQYIGEEIWPIQKAIVEWEDRNDIKKQNRKSTGFPKNKDQSMMRYLDHYVGKVRTQKGEPAGFGHDLGFVSFQEGNDNWDVQLTLTGAHFVQFENPLLDNGPEAPTLSEEEQAFIVTTIRNELNEEYRFMKFVYNVLDGTESSYTKHLEQYRSFLEESDAVGNDPSENSVRSRTGGVISRMVELNIMERGRRRGWYNTKQHPDEYEAARVEP